MPRFQCNHNKDVTWALRCPKKLDSLFNSLFRLSRKTPNFALPDFCEGNAHVRGAFAHKEPAMRGVPNNIVIILIEGVPSNTCPIPSIDGCICRRDIQLITRYDGSRTNKPVLFWEWSIIRFHTMREIKSLIGCRNILLPHVPSGQGPVSI